MYSKMCVKYQLFPTTLDRIHNVEYLYSNTFFWRNFYCGYYNDYIMFVGGRPKPQSPIEIEVINILIFFQTFENIN